jgi:Tol biopolymer transport system component
LEIGSPLSTPKLLLSGRFIENFAWAPDGRALVVDAGLLGPGGLHAMHFYLVNLVIGRIQRVAPLSCCTILAGWTPDGRTLLYWTGEGTSAMKDASVLSGLTIHPPRHFFFHGIGPSREGVPDPDFVTTCGNRLIDVLGAGGPNVAGGPDPTVRNKRLAVMDLHGGPRFLTPAGVAYVDPTCPSDGRFIAAVRFEEGATRGQGRLVLLDSNGVPVKDLTSGPLGDETPEWGPSRTGVVFVHAGTLWFIPEGGAARSTGVPSGSSWDWSATPPAGLSS